MKKTKNILRKGLNWQIFGALLVTTFILFLSGAVSAEIGKNLTSKNANEQILPLDFKKMSLDASAADLIAKSAMNKNKVEGKLGSPEYRMNKWMFPVIRKGVVTHTIVVSDLSPKMRGIDPPVSVIEQVRPFKIGEKNIIDKNEAIKIGKKTKTLQKFLLKHPSAKVKVNEIKDENLNTSSFVVTVEQHYKNESNEEWIKACSVTVSILNGEIEREFCYNRPVNTIVNDRPSSKNINLRGFGPAYTNCLADDVHWATFHQTDCLWDWWCSEIPSEYWVWHEAMNKMCSDGDQCNWSNGGIYTYAAAYAISKFPGDWSGPWCGDDYGSGEISALKDNIYYSNLPEIVSIKVDNNAKCDPNGNGGHAILVKGYNDNSNILYYADPYDGSTSHTIDQDSLNDCWTSKWDADHWRIGHNYNQPRLHIDRC